MKRRRVVVAVEIMETDLSQQFRARQPRLRQTDHFRLNDMPDCPILHVKGRLMRFPPEGALMRAREARWEFRH